MIDYGVFDSYQEFAMTTAVYPFAGDRDTSGIIYTTLGLAGEAGEVANQVKKLLRDDDGVLTNERRKKIIDELGDCLWYIAALAEELDECLGVVVELNMDKLYQRVQTNTIHGDARNE